MRLFRPIALLQILDGPFGLAYILRTYPRLPPLHVQMVFQAVEPLFNDILRTYPRSHHGQTQDMQLLFTAAYEKAQQ
jgi:hypothetical protein